MVSIDGIDYNVPIIDMDLEASFLDKFAERTESGDLQRELIGVYFSQMITFGIGTEKSELGRLWDKLTEPVEFHDVVARTPMGTFTLKMYPSRIKCKPLKMYQSDSYWTGLQVRFTAGPPTRRA